MHHRTTQLSMRTNNSAEAYHRHINSIFQCNHPTLWLFLQKLIDEENVVHVDLVQINAEEPPKKKKLNERLGRGLTNLPNSPHQSILFLGLLYLIFIVKFSISSSSCECIKQRHSNCVIFMLSYVSLRMISQSPLSATRFDHPHPQYHFVNILFCFLNKN